MFFVGGAFFRVRFCRTAELSVISRIFAEVIDDQDDDTKEKNDTNDEEPSQEVHLDSLVHLDDNLHHHPLLILQSESDYSFTAKYPRSCESIILASVQPPPLTTLHQIF